MIRYVFGPEDLGRVRFAISPVFELAASIDVLRNVEAHGLHEPWVRWAGPRVATTHRTRRERLVPARGDHPAFVTPPPDTPRPALDDELDRVRATPADRVLRELGWAFPAGPLPSAAEAFAADVDRGLGELVQQMRAYWDAALAPRWPQLLALLEADVDHHARGLAARGPLGAFADMHPRVRWHDGAVEVEHHYDHEVELGGRGQLLVPTAFAWPEVWAMVDPPWQPSIIYPPRGLGALYAPASTAGALSDLLGRRRAQILAELAVPASTGQLATRLRASPAGVSEHLSVLRRAGLVTGRRAGREVLYARTEAGDALVRSAA
jgi:DNA-binding transcriptional ArsR family regulator